MVMGRNECGSNAMVTVQMTVWQENEEYFSDKPIIWSVLPNNQVSTPVL
jgi:hypothetical protein